jgi:ATP-binding cassette subfamily B protein
MRVASSRLRERMLAARERAAGRLLIARLLPAAGRGTVAAAVLLQLVFGLVPVAFVIATSAVVGRVPAAVGQGLHSPEWRSLRNALIVTGALFLAQQIATPLHWALNETITWRVDRVVRERVAAASFDPVGIAALEDVETADGLGDVVDPMRGYGFPVGSSCAGLLGLVSRYLQWALAAALIGYVYAWWAAVATALGALAVRIGIGSSASRLGSFEGSQAPARRRRDYVRDLLLRPEPGKEVRVFGLLDWLRARYRTLALAAVTPVWRARRRIVLLPYVATAPVSLALAAVATVGAARAAAHGDLGLGELAFVLQAVVIVGSLGDFFWESDYQINVGMWTIGALERFERQTADERDADGGEDDAAGLPRDEIRFDGVAFAYPGSTAPVLRGLDLTIPAGRSLAVVGLNGAGKTTLVKLLARLYEPGEGRILVDGADLRSLPARAWRRRLGAIFQDFVHYELPVVGNVGFGAPELLSDRELVGSALARAGAAEVVDALPHGLDTILSRSYAGGSDLSGGQWQRVAIARALMAVEAGARVLVLDEPTASLDVRAEAEFYDRFLELTRGLTTILISHRFSTVRRADRIVVLEQGTVVEQGTHAELLAAGGRYAELFRLQAARFAGDGAA